MRVIRIRTTVVLGTCAIAALFGWTIMHETKIRSMQTSSIGFITGEPGRGFSFQERSPKIRGQQKKYFVGGSEERVVFFARESAVTDRMIRRTGFFVRRPGAKATVLLCHGYMCDKYYANILRLLFMNYNVMSFDFRAHGECRDGQFCSLGRDEPYDVIGAARFIRAYPDLAKQPLFVYGFSMGAVSSIIAQSTDPHLFDGAIWDCPFDSSRELLNRILDKVKISLFGYSFDLPGRDFLKKHVYNTYVQNGLKAALKIITRLDATRINTTFFPVSVTDAIKKVKIPLLLITCDHDETTAPPEAVRRLYEAAGSAYKRIWITPGNQHFGSLFKNPEAYVYKVHRFIEKVMKMKSAAA